jgi:phage shock protein C
MIGGVCAGIGDHLDIDPTVVRLVAVIALLASFGFVLLVYLLAWIVIPPREFDFNDAPNQSSPGHNHHTSRTWQVYVPGLLLVGAGALILLWENVHWLTFGNFWPVLLIFAGIALLLYKGDSRSAPRHSRPSEHHGETANGHNGGTA